jgi:hypothetical protein
MSRKNLSFAFLAVSVTMAVLAAVTLLPFPSNKMSDLGYAALCPFAPWSTLTLGFLAALAWALRQYVDSRPE